jgi:hypothetical protein
MGIMSTTGDDRPYGLGAPPAPLPPRAPARNDHAWVRFAALVLLVLGVLNVIGGIAALSDAQFFAASHRVFGGSGTHGGLLLAVGALQVLAAGGVWVRYFPAIYLGILLAGLNLVTHLLLLAGEPLWSIAAVALDVLVLNALITHAPRD